MHLFGSLAILYAGFTSSYWAHSFLARSLNLDHFGDVMVGMGVAAILASLLLAGGQAAARKFLPVYLRDREFALMNGFLAFYCGVSLLAAGLTAGLVFAITELAFPDHRTQALFVVTMAPMIAVSTLLGAGLQSIDRPIGAIFPYQIVRPLLLLVGVLLWIELAPFEGTRNAFMVYAPAFALLLVIQFAWYLNALPFAWRRQQPLLDWASWRAAGLPLLLSGLLNSILIRIDILALHLFDDQPKAVGTFTLLVLAASLIWVNYNAVSNIIGQRISPLEGDRAALERLLRRSGLVLLVFNAATAAILIIFARPILATIHPELEVYWLWFAFLCVGATINATLELASPFVRFGGLHAQAARLATPLLGINAAVTTLAVILAGLEGALVSLVAMRFARGLINARLLVRDLGLRPWQVSGSAGTAPERG
ncbi:hypothetical protein [Nitratireductor sp. XY-223]|uniref:hypothetical protein n=1 Tax=Nitratireductor sp. XY-223 TaxID=2561926 RepID=UPI0010A9FAF4|nr:hypothetical protein [Nitratireductor sp. XY-223]